MRAPFTKRPRDLRVLPLGAAMLAAAAIAGCTSSEPSSPLKLDTGASYRFDGWGTSLAWWAEVIGSNGTREGWQTSERDQVLAALFGDPERVSESIAQLPIRPLGLNVLRFNIGASPAGSPEDAMPQPPSDCRSFGAGKAVPSPAQSGPVDLAADARQVDVLIQAKKLIDASARPGEPAIVEAFANSPPWWLTSYHCAAGVLHTDAFAGHHEAAAEYAHYLVDVVSAFHERDIDVATVEPFNEPNEQWWGGCRKDGGCQEGANFSPDAQREVVDALCDELSDRAHATRISANDENKPDDLGKSMPAWIRSGCLAQVNVHGYAGLEPYDGGQRAAVRGSVGDKPLWMSEYGIGPCKDKGDVAGTCSAIKLSDQVADDLQYLRPRAWVYWQALEGAGGWGLLQDVPFPEPPARNGDLYPTARFWALEQYTRYIRGGSTIYPVVRSGDELKPDDDTPRVVAARGAGGRVAVVATNPADHEQPLSISLSPIASQGSAAATRVSLSGRDASFSTPPAIPLEGAVLDDALPPKTVTTYVLGSAPPAPPAEVPPAPKPPAARKCPTPPVQGEGLFRLRAAGVSCAYALRFAEGSRMCELPDPTSHTRCRDRGWRCAVGPGAPGAGGGIHAACTRGADRISWGAGF